MTAIKPFREFDMCQFQRLPHARGRHCLNRAVESCLCEHHQLPNPPMEILINSVSTLAAWWAAEQFEYRTLAVARGDAPVTWLLAEARISWSDVTWMFPDIGRKKINIEVRAAFQPKFEKALRRKSLVGVLRGRVTASEWASKQRSE